MPALKGFRGRLLAGTIIALTMVIYALLLKLIGAETGVSIVGYYVIFAIGVIEMMRRHNIACARQNTPYQQFNFGTWAAAVAAAGYSVWVVFNTRVLIGGPIPTLAEQRERLESYSAAGRDVTEQLAQIQSYIDSPERFAINVWVTLTIFGLVLAALAALVQKLRSIRASRSSSGPATA